MGCQPSAGPCELARCQQRSGVQSDTLIEAWRPRRRRRFMCAPCRPGRRSRSSPPGIGTRRQDGIRCGGVKTQRESAGNGGSMSCGGGSRLRGGFSLSRNDHSTRCGRCSTPRGRCSRSCDGLSTVIRTILNVMRMALDAMRAMRATLGRMLKFSRTMLNLS